MADDLAEDGGPRDRQGLRWRRKSRTLGTCRVIVQSGDTQLCGYPGLRRQHLVCMTLSQTLCRSRQRCVSVCASGRRGLAGGEAHDCRDLEVFRQRDFRSEAKGKPGRSQKPIDLRSVLHAHLLFHGNSITRACESMCGLSGCGEMQ